MGKTLRNLNDILSQLDFIREEKQEYFVCISLDSGQRIIARRIVTIGLLDQVLAHPREVYANPISERAGSIIVAHNHPSGNVHPSSHDIKLTQQLFSAGQLLGIPMRDHIIVDSKTHFSFRFHHMI